MVKFDAIIQQETQQDVRISAIYQALALFFCRMMTIAAL